ncbi:MAG: ExbD/TolR family protein [Jhaorihella sp.]
MQFAPPRPRRRPRENIVPMINVVFLLLIFFLMTAQIAPPEPFEIVPPASDSQDPAEGPTVLYVTADGALAFGAARGEDVFAPLARLAPGSELTIRADAQLPARDLVRLVARLAAAGLTDLSLLTEPSR